MFSQTKVLQPCFTKREPPGSYLSQLNYNLSLRCYTMIYSTSVENRFLRNKRLLVNGHWPSPFLTLSLWPKRADHQQNAFFSNFRCFFLQGKWFSQMQAAESFSLLLKTDSHEKDGPFNFIWVNHIKIFFLFQVNFMLVFCCCMASCSFFSIVSFWTHSLHIWWGGGLVRLDKLLFCLSNNQNMFLQK